MHGYDPHFQSLLSARDAAFDQKQQLWQPMEGAFQETLRLKAKDPRIDSLFDQAQSEHDQGRSAAEASQAAFHNRTGQAGAYSQQKQQHYARRDSLQAEAKALIAHIKADRDTAHRQWDAARRYFIAARDTYDAARAAFNAYRSVHRYISHPGDAELAMQAGVPEQFHGHLYVSMDPQGNRQIYYGGENGDPLGAGHGHYVLDSSGHVTYRRPPQAEHGVQNVVGYKPPTQKQTAKQAPVPANRPPAKPKDQQAARSREDSQRREADRQAREQADQAAREEQRRRDTPWIAAQAAAAEQARTAQLAAEAAARTEATRLERAIQQALAEGGTYMRASDYNADPTQSGIAGFQARQMKARVERILAEHMREEEAREIPVVPLAPLRRVTAVTGHGPVRDTRDNRRPKSDSARPTPPEWQVPTAADHGPARDHRQSPREPAVQPNRQTPPAARPVQPARPARLPKQPTPPPAKPAPAGTGKKWEAGERAAVSEARKRHDSLTAKAKEGSVDITSAQRDYSEVIAAVAGMDGDFGLVCKFRGYHAYVESNINKEGRAKIDIYYGSMGPFGTGHNHAVAYRDDPLMFVADEIRS